LDGKQFFVTTLFEWQIDADPGCEYVAKFLFDADGILIDYDITSFGPRSTMDRQRRVDVRDAYIESLGPVTFERIEVAPFVVEQDGKRFGLIVRVPEAPGDVWAVELLPGNFMAFFEPWDSGIYDT